MTTATATQPDAVQTVADLDAATDQKALSTALQFIKTNLPSRSVLPVLAGVLIEGRDNDIVLSAFDFEISVSEIITGAGTGRALVNARALVDYVKSMDKGVSVTMRIVGRFLILTGDGVTYKIPTLPLDEYPQLPAVTKTTRLCGLGPDQLDGLVDVAQAAGRDETLPVLTGVYLAGKVTENGKRKSTTLEAAATDRYRLAVYDTGVAVSAKFGDKRYLVPARTISQIAKAFKGRTVALSGTEDCGSDGFIAVTDGVRTITSRLLDGVFPKFRSLMPDHSETQLVVDTKVLTKAVRQVAVAASRTSPVRLTVTDSVLLEAGGLDDTEAEKRIEAGVTGPEVTMAFNPHYLLDGADAVGCDTVAINIVAPTKPAVLTGVGRPEFQYLLMPVRLAG